MEKKQIKESNESLIYVLTIISSTLLGFGLGYLISILVSLGA